MVSEAGKLSRPPVVVVLGHVDHGKTTLLDRIRNTDIAAREAGGITQSTGAWQVRAGSGQTITFIDTPGHEAFSSMRQRGARIADVAILVVAADDGVMPQTSESIQYLVDSQTPFLVAITKVDLASADPGRVRDQLVQEGVLLEGKGGDVVSVEVSSTKGQGIDELLEMVLLLAQLHQISAEPQGSLEAVVVETKLDRRRGPVVSVVVKNGTLRLRDQVAADGVIGRVRGLFDQSQKAVGQVGPGMPAEILGFDKLPEVGSVVKRAQPDADASYRAEQKIAGKVAGKVAVIIKADTAGSLEAITNSLADKVQAVFVGIGDISESDVMLASTTQASLVGFNVRVPSQVARLAEEERVPVYNHRIIYELLADVARWQKEKEEAKERMLGKATIIAQFPHAKEKRIAGAKVAEGRIAKNDRLRLVRDEEVLGAVRILSLKKGKASVAVVQPGEEFGVLFEPQLDFRLGDMLESYTP